MVAFRLRAKQIFLTYPQADGFNRDDLLDHLRREACYVIVARELHADGGVHYHAGIQYPTVHNITDSRCFDFREQHPNIQGVRNWTATTNYIRKCGDFAEYGTDTSYKSTTTLREDAISGTKATEALNKYLESKPGAIRGYRSLLADYNQFQHDFQHRSLTPDESKNRFNACTIGKCLTFTFSTKFKSPKLYIWGPPNVGKTTLLQQYDSRFIFHAPDNNDWSGFNDSFYKLIVFDEFHGQVPLSTLLKLMQGSPTRLNTKGGSIDCTKNMPMIFLSNIHACRSYQHSDAFIARLKIFHMYAFHEIELG